jgi:hypothetical protein
VETVELTVAPKPAIDVPYFYIAVSTLAKYTNAAAPKS